MVAEIDNPEDLNAKYKYYLPIFKKKIKGNLVDILASYINVSKITVYNWLKGEKPRYADMILFIHFSVKILEDNNISFTKYKTN